MLLGALGTPLYALEIVGHRGASYDAPENTLASLKLGWEQQGADGCELDVYLTKDGRIAGIHDKTTKRTTGTDGNVGEMTLDQLRQLDAGSWKGPQWKGEKIPTLEEALAAIPKGKKIFIEIKSGPEIVPELERVIKASKVPEKQLVFIAFGHETIKLAESRMPGIETYWLASAKKDKDGALPSVDSLIAKAKEAKVDGLDLDHRFNMDEAFVRRIKKAGLKLHVWTVNDAEVGQRLAALGVDGITTDRPEWLREQIKAGKAAGQ